MRCRRVKNRRGGSGEQRYGEMYSQAMDATELDYGTLRDAKWVSSQFELSCRHDNLSFKHHREVAALPHVQADAILDRAESEGLSTREVRQLVRQLRQRIMWRPTPHYLAKVGKVGAEIEVRNATNPSKKDVDTHRCVSTLNCPGHLFTRGLSRHPESLTSPCPICCGFSDRTGRGRSRLH